MTITELIDAIARNITGERVDIIQLREDLVRLADTTERNGWVSQAYVLRLLEDRIEALEAVLDEGHELDQRDREPAFSPTHFESEM